MGLFGGGSKTSSTASSGGVVSAEQMRKAFMQYMDQNDIKYAVLDESDNLVALTFGGSKYDTFVLVDFDEGGNCDSVHFSSQHFAKCELGSLPNVIIKLNELNRRFRWLKFWVDEEGHLTADSDAIIEIGSVGAECVQAAFRISDILEDALEALEGFAVPDEETANAIKLAMLMKKLG